MCQRQRAGVYGARLFDTLLLRILCQSHVSAACDLDDPSSGTDLYFSYQQKVPIYLWCLHAAYITGRDRPRKRCMDCVKGLKGTWSKREWLLRWRWEVQMSHISVTRFIFLIQTLLIACLSSPYFSSYFAFQMQQTLEINTDIKYVKLLVDFTKCLVILLLQNCP